jgi:iron(III) transport system permease protein
MSSSSTARDFSTAGLTVQPSRQQLTRRWHLFSLPIAALVLVPLLVIFSGWLSAETDIWRHLAETVLADLIVNTLVLLLGVMTGVLLLGVSLAWLTTMCDFPGRRFFDWALMLPLALPAYVLAFVFLGLLDFSGPVQGLLRNWFGPHGYWFPEVRSTGAVILVMVLVLYPYVYMLARTAFLTQGRGTLDAARILGLSPWRSFFRIALPMARPAIAAGTALALMETLADFGTVAVFNYDTFTTAIYKTWFGLFSLQAASQLASLLLLFVASILIFERRFRGQARYAESSRGGRPHRIQLNGWRAWLVTVFASFVFLSAFALPLMQLLAWSWEIVREELDPRYFDLVLNTLMLGISAAFVTVTGALLLAFARRYQNNGLTGPAVTIATLGYALPGSVLAVGIMLTFTGVDNFIQSIARSFGIDSLGPVLTGTIFALLLAYLVRFLAVAYGPLESTLGRIRHSLPEAARSLGATPKRVLTRVYLPLLSPGILTALLLVTVDVMKEMPATLLLRPFGWDTLAVRIYELTSEGEWQRAALPATTLVLAGLLPVILLVIRSARTASVQGIEKP